MELSWLTHRELNVITSVKSWKSDKTFSQSITKNKVNTTYVLKLLIPNMPTDDYFYTDVVQNLT